MYKGAESGTLTDFVQRNPNALLLFGEIEKAHPSTVHLFLQVLDAGRLQDKFTEQTVEFRDTVILFTINVGRKLYENQNRAGVHQASAAFHRSTLLDALRTEVDPWTHVPYFPAAICSRLATGYPILFNHLRVSDLAQIAAAQLTRTAKLLEQRHGPHYIIADEIPLALVMREGANTDARTVKAQAEAFLKEEVFKACQLFTGTHIDAAFERTQTVRVELDPVHAGETAERVFRDRRAPNVLFVGDELLVTLYREALPAVEWWPAASADQAFDSLAKHDVDLVLLDLSLQPKLPAAYADLADAFYAVSAPSAIQGTHVAFDHSPPAARRFAIGQQLLEQLHVRSPETPPLPLCHARGHSGNGATGAR